MTQRHSFESVTFEMVCEAIVNCGKQHPWEEGLLSQEASVLGDLWGNMIYGHREPRAWESLSIEQQTLLQKYLLTQSC